LCHYGVEERPIKSFGRKTDGRNPLGRPKNRWQDNITIDLHEMVSGNINWIDLAQDRERCRAASSFK